MNVGAQQHAGTQAPTAPVQVFVGIGSNVGDRTAHVAHALAQMAALPQTTVVRCSQVIETAPVGPAGQGPYLNAVAELSTALAPAALLEALLAIERQRGRDRSREVRFGPRTLDLDILLYSDWQIDEPHLRIPHPRMPERPFVLIPLAEIAPSVAARVRTTAIH